MTRIIIASTKEERESLAVTHITELLGREFESFLDLLKIPDIHYLTSTENSLGIDEVKKFIQKMMYKPFEEGYQIAIIDNSDILTTEAQNSLLKTLEDSGDDTIFILLVRNEKNLLETILSRGSKYYGSTKESVDIQDSVDEFISMDTVSRISYVEKLGTDSERDEISTFLKSLLSRYNQSLVKLLREGKNTDGIIFHINTIQEAINGIDGNANKKLALFNMVVQMG
jgi:hypothetical protein